MKRFSEFAMFCAPGNAHVRWAQEAALALLESSWNWDCFFFNFFESLSRILDKCDLEGTIYGLQES